MNCFKLICRFFVLLVWAAVLPIASQTFDLDSLLVISVGGPQAVEKLRHVKSVKTTGTVSLNGMEGNFVQFFQLPDKFYLEVSFGEFSVVQSYDGTNAWQKDLNGSISQLNGFEKRELLKTSYFESYAYLFADRVTGSYEYLGLVSDDTCQLHHVAFSPLLTDTVEAFYDVITGLRRQTISRTDNLKSITNISDYRTVEGILWPFYSRAVSEDSALITEFRVDTIEVNVILEPTFFSMPINEETAYHFPSGAMQVVVPISYEHGHIRLPVILNGKRKVWMILDSGASSSIFHKSSMNDISFEVVGTLPAKGLGNYQQAEVIKLDSLMIGEIVLRGHLAGLLDLSRLARLGPDGESFGGLLGYDFLSMFPVLIDYKNLTLTIYNPDRYSQPGGGIEIPFELIMQVPTIHGELSGNPGLFLVDLGNAFGLIVHEKYVSRYGQEQLFLRTEREPFKIGGISKPLIGRTALANSFQIGNVHLDSVMVILPETASGLAGSEELAGNIGNQLLEQFCVLFDYQRSRIVLYPKQP